MAELPPYEEGEGGEAEVEFGKYLVELARLQAALGEQLGLQELLAEDEQAVRALAWAEETEGRVAVAGLHQGRERQKEEVKVAGAQAEVVQEVHRHVRDARLGVGVAHGEPHRARQSRQYQLLQDVGTAVEMAEYLREEQAEAHDQVQPPLHGAVPEDTREQILLE